MLQNMLDRLVSLRRRADLSAWQLSLKINRHGSYMSKIEDGQFEPSFNDVEIIVRACGSNMEEFCYENFDSYRIDKEILNKVREINPNEKQAFLTLLVAMNQLQKKDRNVQNRNDFRDVRKSKKGEKVNEKNFEVSDDDGVYVELHHDDVCAGVCDTVTGTGDK